MKIIKSQQNNTINIKIVIEYAMLFICLMICSTVYASDAGLSRRKVVLLLLPLMALFFIGKRYINDKWHKYILFSVCYWVVAFPSVNSAFENKCIAVAGSDAVVQMYPAMLYISRQIREFFDTLFTEARCVFPMWEWSLGMGENTISTLNYYGFGDPFYVLSAFFSEDNLPYFYTVLFYFRMYLGGIVCIAFFYELDSTKTAMAYVVGALVYSFSGFSYYSNVFIIFVHAMMYTPMVLWGAERVLKEKKKGILLSATFLYALSGFFFLYVSSITLAIYVIYRLITEKTELKKAVYKILELLGEYLVGLMLSAVIFVPSVMGYLASSRTGTFTIDVGLLSFQEFKEILINIFLPQYSDSQVVGMCVIAILCIIWMLFARKKYAYKVNIILLFLSMIIPIVSVIMSGGGYYDRWELVIILYGSYLTFIMWDEIKNLTWIQKLASVGGWLILLGFGISQGISLQSEYGFILCSYGIFMLFVLIMFPICQKYNKNVVGSVLLFIVTLATVYKSWAYVACEWEIFFVRQDNVIDELITDDSDDFYRIEYEKTFGEPRLGMNIALMLDYPGITQYFSIENGYYVDAFGEWETGEKVFCNQGMDYRTILETLSSVKYFIAHSDNKLLIPYGFEYVKESADGAWKLYKNQYALPLVYAYDKVFAADVYNEDMNGLEKQNVLLQAAAIEDYDGLLPIISEVNNHLYEGQYTIDSLQDGEMVDGQITVEAGAVMKLTAKLKANCENYIYFDDKIPVNITIDGKHLKTREKTTLGIVSEDVDKEVVIEFYGAATFSIDSMNIYHFDFENYEEYIGNMKIGYVSDIIVDSNTIECNAKLDGTKILCIAVPYEKGWTAEIDGIEAKIYRMNNMFMGIEVSEGEHSIHLSYTTPGLRTGVVLSGLGLVIICVYMVVKRKQNKL